MRPRAGFVLLGLGLVAVALAVYLLAGARAEGPPPSARPPYVLPVTLGSVRRGTLVPSVELTGSVRSLRTVELAFELDGAIAALEVGEGARVEAGAVLARLTGRDQELGLGAARADHELVLRELARLEAGEREEDKRRLQAEVEVAVASERLAKIELDRSLGLLEERVTSQADVDRLRALHEAAVGRSSAAREVLARAAAGTRAEDLEVARARVAVAATALDRAAHELEKTRLTAPFAGNVVRRLRTVGDFVSAGDAVLEFVDLAEREVEIDLAPRYALRLGPGAKARIRLDERPEFELSTVLGPPIPAADPASRNFRALIPLGSELDREQVLLPGMYVRVALELSPLADAWIVPNDALRHSDSGTIVVRARPPAAGAAPAGPPGMPPLSSAEWIAVRVLGSDGRESAILPMAAAGGEEPPELAEGDALVQVGLDLAFPGAPLLPRADAALEARPAAGEAAR